jgi:hypothetical protein
MRVVKGACKSLVREDFVGGLMFSDAGGRGRPYIDAHLSMYFPTRLSLSLSLFQDGPRAVCLDFCLLSIPDPIRLSRFVAFPFLLFEKLARAKNKQKEKKQDETRKPKRGNGKREKTGP